MHDVLTRGAPNARKALFEALIHEIKVNSDDALTPYFRFRWPKMINSGRQPRQL